MTEGIVALATLISVNLTQYPTIVSPVADKVVVEQKQEQVLASQSLDLTNRYEKKSVNEVFRDNILLALYYLKGEEITRKVDWEKVRQPWEISFILLPGEVFAFHQNILPEFKNIVVKTLGSRFTAEDGYKTDGFLYGDGVCHLASLMHWTAGKAGLEITAMVRHDFAKIPDIPKEFGTSIKYCENGGNSKNQNLYIKNSFDFPVEFWFKVESEKVELKIVKLLSY